MLVGKWTVEGALKSQGMCKGKNGFLLVPHSSGESIAQRFVRVREGGCVGICKVHGASCESRWYRRFIIKFGLSL